ncbi:UNVERIFIED_CONTAM: hypothetical protein K2H54_057797 [Gekko kuhli]
MEFHGWKELRCHEDRTHQGRNSVFASENRFGGLFPGAGVWGGAWQDLTAKIEAMEWAKMEKWKHAEDGASVAVTSPGVARATARKWERRALYARLAQLQESMDEEDTQEFGGRRQTP